MKVDYSVRCSVVVAVLLTRQQTGKTSPSLVIRPVPGDTKTHAIIIKYIVYV